MVVWVIFMLFRHHCRECRGIFCNGCTGKRLAKPHRLAGVRVCDSCYDKISHPPASGKELSDPASSKDLTTPSTAPVALPPHSRRQQCLRKIKFFSDIMTEVQQGVRERSQHNNSGFVQEYSSFDQILPKVILFIAAQAHSLRKSSRHEHRFTQSTHSATVTATSARSTTRVLC